METPLDQPTVMRAGQPTLGQPVMSLAYRHAGAPGEVRQLVAVHEPATQYDIQLLQAQLNRHFEEILALQQRVVALERPWWRRLRDWVEDWLFTFRAGRSR